MEIDRSVFDSFGENFLSKVLFCKTIYGFSHYKAQLVMQF